MANPMYRQIAEDLREQIAPTAKTGDEPTAQRDDLPRPPNPRGGGRLIHAIGESTRDDPVTRSLRGNIVR